MGTWITATALVLAGWAKEPGPPPPRFTVVAFLGVECPMAALVTVRLNELHAKYSQQGVAFRGFDPCIQDTAEEMAAFAREHNLAFPLEDDDQGKLARRCGVTRTPTVVVVDAEGQVRYRGQVNDQFAVGRQKGRATEEYLRDVLEHLLAGCEPRFYETEQIGCEFRYFESKHFCGVGMPWPVRSIDEETERPYVVPQTTFTYANDIDPILRRHCVECHRAGAVGPMPLDSYEQVRGWAAMIDEVVAQDRMPPWKADRTHGPFVGQTSLNYQERAKLRRWIAGGCPPGDLSIVPPPRQPTPEWSIGKPDCVVELPTEQIIPPTGIVEYRILEVDPGFTSDRWVSAVEVRPTDREVVHHCNVFLKPPGSDEAAEAGSLGSVCLAAMAAGTPPVRYRPGMAKRIPAGWKLVFVMHYVTVGTERRDRTQLGLQFVEPETVEREVATRLLVDEYLEIPPHAADHRVTHETRLPRDLLLLAIFPHMHLRGKSFEYEAEYPDGRRETLLRIPQWDFGWQYRYELAEPKRLPAGTIVRATAVYDNSSANPANPDPSVTVRTGPKSDDEMFNAYFDVAYADPKYPTRTPWHRTAARGAALGFGVLALVMRWRGRRKAQPTA